MQTEYSKEEWLAFAAHLEAAKLAQRAQNHEDGFRVGGYEHLSRFEIEQSEEWRPISGGYVSGDFTYEVSNLGRVRYQYSQEVLPVSTWLHPGRVKGVFGVAKQLAERVLEAFVSPRPSSLGGKRVVCCHFDDDPSNNRLANLRWGTDSGNAVDRVRNGLGSNKIPYETARPLRDVLRQFRPRDLHVIAEAAGVSASTLLSLRNGKSWKHLDQEQGQ